MWHAFVEFGGLLFWGIFGIVLLVEFLFVLKEETGWSFGLLALFAAATTLFTTFNVRAFVATGWKTALLWTAGYVVVGVVWAIVRWILHASRRRAFFYEKKREWAERNGLPDCARLDFKDWTSQDYKNEFLLWFAKQWNDADFKMVRGYSLIHDWDVWKRHNSGSFTLTTDDMAKKVFAAVVPQARHEKSRITLWLSFWPFSVLCYLLEDMLVDFYRWLVRVVSGIMRGINRLVFAGMKKELEA